MAAKKYEHSEVADPHRFRVTIICACRSDYAEGYGHTAAEARTNAYAFFHKNHGRRTKPVYESLERVTPDGSHYEEVV